jgi:hypothetical protein
MHEHDLPIHWGPIVKELDGKSEMNILESMYVSDLGCPWIFNIFPFSVTLVHFKVFFPA